MNADKKAGRCTAQACLRVCAPHFATLITKSVDCMTRDEQELTMRRALQVSSRTASAAAQSAATRLGRGKAALALELVGYDEDLSAAMKYAFGSAFVCKASQLPPSRSARSRQLL